MKSLFDPSAYREIKSRFNTLTVENLPNWGKMNVAQMVTHCQFPLTLALSEKPRKVKWNPVAKLFKKTLYNDKTWFKSLPTAKQAKVTDQRDLAIEREKLLSMIDTFYNKKEQTVWLPHPYFGNFTPEQWGKLEYKHLDYHLGQFGV